MFKDYISKAEYIIQCAEQHCHTQKSNSSSKWKSIHSTLQDVVSEETKHKVHLDEALKKRHCLAINPLQKLCQNNKSLNRLIVNLFPSDNGYSLMLKTSSMQYAETIQLPYDEYELLQYIDNEQIPPLLVETLNLLDDNMFYSGCVIVEIRDYRIAACLTNYETKFVLLRPTQQTLMGDVNAIAAETSHLYTWENDEKLTLESYLILATSEPLCLAPSPSVQVMKNILNNQKKVFKRHSIRRCIRRHGMKSLLRRKENKTLETPEPLKLFDFLQKSKKKRNEQNPGSGFRLPKNVVDVWSRAPLDLPLPTNGIEVSKYAKLIDSKPPNVLGSDLLEVQQLLLRSESQARDVFSRITIYQRPSDMQYFGRLQSNKYFQPSNESTVLSTNTRFQLGTEERANLYILQYQELFAEDGRRPASVTVHRPLQQEKVHYQIPYLHQPWQLEQDKTLYAVGSINNIPTKHWHRLRVYHHPLKQRVSGQQMVVNIPQRPQSTNQSMPSGSAQQLNRTTPTLNAVTLQPEAQSPFIFPTSQSGETSQSPRQLLTPLSIPGLERKMSTDAIMVNTADGTVFLPEAIQSGRRSRHGSTQEIFNFSTVNIAGNQLHSSSSDASLATPAMLDVKPVEVIAASNINKQPIYQANVSQQQGAVHSATVHHQGKPTQSFTVQTPNGGAATVLRMPVSINTPNSSGGQQLAINLLSNARNGGSQSANIQQIQLAPSSRVSGATVNVNTGQISAEFAMQLAAAANQLQQEKASSSASGVQQLSISTSGNPSSGPITLVANNNTIAGAIQPQQIRAVSGNQQTQFIRATEQPTQSATITYNPRTQRAWIGRANVRGNDVQQAVQLVQVGSNTIQQLPIRLPGQQVVRTTGRTSTAESSGQMSLAQHLQFSSSNLAGANPVKRGRKRKATPENK